MKVLEKYFTNWAEGDEGGEGGEGGETAITEMKAKTAMENAYNISGQRVNNNYRGLVIQNGRKFYQK